VFELFEILSNFKYENTEKTFFLEHKQAVSVYEEKTQHFHNNYEIFYLIKGDRYYFIKDKTYFIRAGDLVLINIADLHRSTGAQSNNYERLLINFKQPFIMSSSSSPIYDSLFVPFQLDNHVIHLNVREQSFIENNLSKMFREAQAKRSGYEAYLQSLLIEVLIFASRYTEDHQKRFEHLSPAHKRISEITQYMNEHYMDQITLKTISDKFFISKYHLIRVFKEVTGFTFIEYLNTVRVKNARIMLLASNKKIIEISIEVGFGSISHFNRVFRTILNCSPIKYRHMHKI
jgi:AraC-like DNA-binding protein